ncbi:MAG: SDR family oxidoreductase [Methanocorpusculum sp.]|nr:SDR family oxidoreductase [Methanocorpusculum sp.]
MKLQGKTAIITGGSRGIGYAIAGAFVREGARVAVCGSRPASAEKAAESLRAACPGAEILPLGVDVADSASVAAMVDAVMKKWGRIDILVNNAGITAAKPITEMSDADFTDLLNINLVGPFLCTREVARVMIAQKGGSIINTSSMVGIYGGRNQTAYAASKFGVNGLTKSCAKELGPYGIRVNAVAPGVVGTDMVAESVTDAMMAAMKSITPLGRVAEPKELAGAYVYLASDDASFTTGAIVSVDGGIVM